MQSNHHIGRITNEPKFEYVGDPTKPMAKLTICLAVDRNSRKNSPTDFLYYVALDKSAEVLNGFNLSKGMIMEMFFTQQSQSFTRSDGSRGYSTQNMIQNFKVWSHKSDQNNLSNATTPAENTHDSNYDNPFGIPDYRPENFI